MITLQNSHLGLELSLPAKKDATTTDFRVAMAAFGFYLFIFLFFLSGLEKFLFLQPGLNVLLEKALHFSEV